MNTRKFSKLSLALLTLLLITGCAAPTTLPPPTAVVLPPTATLADTNTPIPPTATPTPTQTLTPTPTPTQTFTPTPTPTPTATNTPLPTATPTLSNIQVANVAALRLQARFGLGTLQNIRFSPDGAQFLVLTSASMQLYDTQTAQLHWQQNTPSIYSQIAFSQDGGKIIAATDGGAALAFDAKTGERTATLLEATANNSFASLSEFGDLLVICDLQSSLTAFETATGKKLLDQVNMGENFALKTFKIHPNGKELIVFGNQVQILNLADGKKTGSYTLPADNYRTYHGLEFSPDGTQLALLTLGNQAGYSTSRIYIWAAGENKPIQNYQFEKLMVEFAFSADGKEILVGDADGAVRAFDIQTMQELRKYKSLGASITNIAVSADGKWIVLASQEGEVSIQDYTNPKEVSAVSLSLSKTGYGTIGAALAPDGQTLAISAPDAKSVRIVNLTTGETVQSLGTESKGHTYNALAYSSDGRVAAAREDFKIAVWDLKTGNQALLITTGYDRKIAVVKFSPDGKYLAALSDIQLFVWEAKTGNKIRTFYGYYTFDFSPDGRYIASDNVDYGLYVWNVENGKQVASVTSEYIFDVAYAPDGQTIAISCWDMKAPRDTMNLVYFVDATKNYQNKTMELVDHLNYPFYLAYSPDGSLLASGDARGNIYLWDTRTGSQVMKLAEVTDLVDIFFTPDRLALVVVGSDGAISVYGVR